MKKTLVTLLLLLCLLPFGLAAKTTLPATAYLAPGPTPEPRQVYGGIVEQVILAAAIAERDQVYPVPLFDIQLDNLNFSADGKTASAWLLWVHLDTGEVIPSEPGLAFAVWDGEAWQAALAGDPLWLELVEAGPEELLPASNRQEWLELARPPVEGIQQVQVYSGYKLPWEGGKSMFLTRSVSHDKDVPSGNSHYAFDFAMGSLFDIYAAKAGTVWLYKDNVPNGTPSDSNYIVLEDTSTNPTTYQLYLHLAENSIPAELKQAGAPVVQGQFIGIADDTGISTGHHLHFQVQTLLSQGYYWGKSVDVVFSDVDINGGRPRTSVDLPYCTWPGDVCGVTRQVYISGNDTNKETGLPRGDLTAPLNGITLENSSLTLAGWASDNESGLGGVQLRGRYQGVWHNIGPVINASPFSYNWNLCNDQVPDGPVSLALDIWDAAGNHAIGLPGLRHFIKSHTCPITPPACVPSAGQVALFASPDFQGKCVLLNQGNYSGSMLGAVGSDNTASIQVGTGSMATLYDKVDLSGRGETFHASDRSLSDNRIGADTVSSLIVQPASQLPFAPHPTWPTQGASFPAESSVSLVWEDYGGASEFLVQLDGVSQSWQASTVYHLGSLPANPPTWRVKARNANGESAWSAIQTLAIQTSTPGGSPAVSAPFIDGMEALPATLWTHSNYWDGTSTENHTTDGSKSWMYDTNSPQGYNTGAPNSGDLTSPPINIPGTGYAARFWYRYETESPGVHWDQRWVQISKNGGAFVNVLQLSDDPPNHWVQSPAIDLSAYAGASIRVRFHFETLDERMNGYRGWFIDDFSVTSAPAFGCTGSGEPDASPSGARAIAYNSSLTGVICPAGDVDYFRFAGKAGDQIGIRTRAQVDGSSLDTQVALLDSDFASVLAENDDQVVGVITDSFVSYRLNRTGTYYIKLKAWDHPGAGGSQYTYTLSLYAENSKPEVANISPPSGSFLAGNQVMISVSASDAPSGSGASHVDFFWHSQDWQTTDWVYLGSDWNGQDGWSYLFDTSSLPDQKDIAIYAQTYDWAGNQKGAGAWQLVLNRNGFSQYLPFMR